MPWCTSASPARRGGGLIGWFLLYGAYFGFAEGAEKALVADLTPRGRQGTAFGYYNAALGGGALIASVAFGFLYQRFGPASRSARLGARRARRLCSCSLAADGWLRSLIRMPNILVTNDDGVHSEGSRRLRPRSRTSERSRLSRRFRKPARSATP
jgi:MFS family permease